MELSARLDPSRPPSALGRLSRYGVAVAVTVLVLMASLALSRVFHDPAPLILFIVAVMVSAWHGGLAPGLVSTGLGAVAGSFFLLEPYYSLSVNHPADWLRLGVYLATGGMVSWLCEALHRARRQAEAQARTATARRQELETQIAVRERVEAEREQLVGQLETERARLEAVIEHIPAGVVLAEAPSGRILLGNPQVEKILGHPILPTSDIQGYRNWGTRHVDGRRLEPEEHSLSLALRGEVVRQREFIYERPDGSTIWFKSSAAPIHDAKGEIAGAVVLFQDVDAEKKAEQAEAALRLSEQRLTLALDAAQMGSWHLELATFELTCSAACKANFGRPPNLPFTYEALREAILPDDLPLFVQAVQRAVEERTEYQAEYRVLWPEGSVHWIAARGRVTYDEAGRPLFMDGVTLDLTQRKTLEESLRRQTEALQAADRRKDEFLATLSHELRNPLAPILNALEILGLRGDDPATVARVRGLMERQVRQMVRMVDDLLEVSRIAQGKIALQKEPMELARVVATAIETSRPLIEARRHELSVGLPEEPLRLTADAARLAQVLSNLLNNAAKYTHPGGRIELTAEQRNGQAVVRVRDNGFGLAAEMLPRVFDLFSQAEGARDHAQGGLGIGLTLVRRLVEMHGGTVEAHSEGLGLGSEFVVRLPA